MKQVFLKFLLVFFLVSQLIIAPMQTAFASELTDESMMSDLGTSSIEQQPHQEAIQISEEIEQNQPVSEQQIEVQQEHVRQVTAMRAPQQVNVTTKTTINEVNKLINDGDELRLKIDWAVPPGVKVQAGDYFYIPVSSNLAMFNGTTINLDGKGSCIVEGTQVKCTLSDFVNDKDNVKGFIGFGAKLNSGLTPGQGEQSTQVTVNGETITLTVNTGTGQTGGPVDRVISKFGVRDTADSTKIHWQIALNETKSNELGRIVLNDTIGEGHKLLTDTVSIIVVDAHGQRHNLEAMAGGYFINGIHVTEQSIGADVNLPGATMLISYFTEITDITKTKWTNDATITANNVNQTENSFVEQYTEGGAQGDLAKYNGEFIVTKVNEAGEVLAGATFTFTNGTQTYTLTTDANGKASTGEIPGGIYTLKEETAPDGYTIAEEYATGKEITLNFKDNKTVEQTVENKAIKVEKVNISGTKTWEDRNDQDGKRPAHITVNLLADGKVIASEKVTKAADWQWNFTDLPKYEEGQAINYTISEEAVPEYSTTVDGFNLTNSYTPGQTSVQVTKVWVDENNQDGLRPKSVTIQLVADGQATDQQLTLTEANNWTGTFTELPEYAAGKQVVYTVEEVAVPGYEGVITGDATSGFIVTNIHEVEPTEPTEPTEPEEEEKPGVVIPEEPEAPEEEELPGVVIPEEPTEVEKPGVVIPEEPIEEVPSEEETPELPIVEEELPETVTPESDKTDQPTLPQTGEEKYMMSLAAGLIMILLGGSLLYRREKNS